MYLVIRVEYEKVSWVCCGSTIVEITSKLLCKNYIAEATDLAQGKVIIPDEQQIKQLSKTLYLINTSTY
jgi:hypothetical protein